MITNKYNIPGPIFKAVNREYQQQENRFSVTDLINPPLIRKLKLQHWDELSEDASERLWALLGQAVDHIISQNAAGAIVQDKFEIAVDGAIIVGRKDIEWPEKGIIEDWKVTSVWSFLLGEKLDWERQLNCYAWGTRKQGRAVTRLKINAILRDWQKSKMLRDNDYPRIPFVSREIPLWSFEQQEQYIKDQLEYHRMAEPEECSPEGKWEKPTTYAVMKKGRKTALRVLDSKDNAIQWCLDNNYAEIQDEPEGKIGRLAGNIEIETRSGECVRCKSYCPVRMVCPYNKGEKE
jgi:hypothetical protein